MNDLFITYMKTLIWGAYLLDSNLAFLERMTELKYSSFEETDERKQQKLKLCLHVISCNTKARRN